MASGLSQGDRMKLKVGDRVFWRGSFGSQTPKEAVIKYITLCEVPRGKYGELVQEVEWSKIKYTCVDLENGSWAYGEQINPIPNSVRFITEEDKLGSNPK